VTYQLPDALRRSDLHRVVIQCRPSTTPIQSSTTLLRLADHPCGVVVDDREAFDAGRTLAPDHGADLDLTIEVLIGLNVATVTEFTVLDGSRVLSCCSAATATLRGMRSGGP
jgi:hypothetical protein